LKIIFKTDEENQNMSEAKSNEEASTAQKGYFVPSAAKGATSKIKNTSLQCEALLAPKALNDICYEQIKDNFYYGKFGEFRLVIDKNTGCFNATKLCQLSSTKKQFSDWKKLSRSQELLDYYNKKRCPENSLVIFYEVKQANYGTGKLVTGQYVQKEFILDIASWISPAFYFKCSKIVNYFFIELYKKDLELKEQQLKEANKQILDERQRANEYKEMALDFQTLAISNCKLEQTQVIYMSPKKRLKS
jgi:hypothetical protein